MIRFCFLLTILLGLSLLCACANPAADQPKAVTTQAAPVSSPAVSGERYLITSENSKVEFVASKVTGSHHGGFGKVSGAIDYAGTPENSRVTINIQTNSVTTDTPDLTRHLQTADFFDVAKYPQATFASTQIKAGGDNAATHTVTGNLELHGVTRSITFPASIKVAPDAITVDSTFSLNRKDFGINYAGAADNLIRDEVVLTLKVRAVK